MKTIQTTCSYCGCGCNLNLHVEDNRIKSASPVKNHPVNDGELCLKGLYGWQFVHSPERLHKPYIRKLNGIFSKDGVLEESEWDEALDLLSEKIQHVKRAYGPDSFMGLSSARCTNEENYIFQKFFRQAIGTNNVDNCARLCHAPTVAGLAASLGSGSMTNDFTEFGVHTKCFLIIGSNTSENHPIAAMHVFRGLANGAKLIVIDPRKTEMANKADIYIQNPPGYNIPLLNSLIHVIIREKLYDADFVEKHTRGFEYVKKTVQDYSPEKVSAMTGIDGGLIIKAARMYAATKPAAIIYGMGVTQFSHGTGNVWNTSNLAAITGNLGIRGAGVNPLRGQNNVQGACMVAALPAVLPNGRPVTDEAGRKEVNDLWRCEVPSKPGIPLSLLPENMEKGNIKFLWIFGENPVMSDPDTDHFTHALKHLEFMVVQDIFMSETCSNADMVLPAACFAEKEGTFVNTSRRVQLVNKAVDPPGEAKPDWEIVIMVARRLGREGFDFRDAKDIWDEIRIINRAQFGGMDYRRLRDLNGLNAPCPNHQHPGTPVLYEKNKFSTPDGKALLVPLLFTEDTICKEELESEWRNKLNLDKDYPLMAASVNETASEKYPYILLTGRYVHQYHTGTMTRKCKALETGADMFSPTIIEIGIAAAKKLKIASGDCIKVQNERGNIVAKARIMERITSNIVFGNIHFWESNVNELTNSSGLDPVSKTPELKISAVNIVKITEEEYLAVQIEKRIKYNKNTNPMDSAPAVHGTINMKNINRLG